MSWYAAADSHGDELRRCAAVMVWVNPVEEGQDRARLDASLDALHADGVLVSAAGPARRTLGTKTAIHRTRSMPWGTDSRLYGTFDEFATGLPVRLRALGPRVLKQERGHSGQGVWKVALDDASARIETTNAGTDTVTTMHLDAFLDDWRDRFVDGSIVVEQPFLPRVAEGMIRCYVTGARVLGLIHQLPKDGGLNVSRSRLVRTNGLADGTYFYPVGASPHDELLGRLQASWLPQLCELTGLRVDDLPVLWDIDFIARDGHDDFALCEMNVNSVSPPTGVPLDAVATTLAARLA